MNKPRPKTEAAVLINGRNCSENEYEWCFNLDTRPVWFGKRGVLMIFGHTRLAVHRSAFGSKTCIGHRRRDDDLFLLRDVSRNFIPSRPFFRPRDIQVKEHDDHGLLVLRGK